MNKPYRGNPLIPRANSPRPFTKDQVNEIVKCMKDPIYYANEYFKVVHVDKGLVPLKLYDYQKEAIEAIATKRNVLLCWSRQSGKTTAACPAILHYATFNEEKTVAILANKATTARQILDRIKKAYEHLPDWLKPGVVEWNKSKVIFDNGSVIMADSTSSDTVRGFSISFLYIDEAAFIRNWDEFSASVMPTITSGKETKIVMTSTPNGLNHFFYYVEGARNGTNDFWLSEIPWYKVPGRNEKWKEQALAQLNGDKIKFACEYELEFSGSSNTLIAPHVLKTLKPVEPIRRDNGNTIAIYERPKKDHVYVLIADVSRGKGLDYSAFNIIDVTDEPYKQVATFKDNLIVPADYANIVQTMAMRYNDAYILVEINDIGGQVIDCIFENEYENIIYTENRGRGGKRISGGFGKNIDRGIRTTLQVRNTGCINLKLLIEEKRLIINDMKTIEELVAFVKKGNRYEADEGHHDDLVMSLVLFAWMTSQEYFREITDLDIIKQIKERRDEQIMENILPFIIDDDQEDEGIIIDIDW